MGNGDFVSKYVALALCYKYSWNITASIVESFMKMQGFLE